jgi:tRNA uridine 5-carbamoylmethylation protein Kti12
MRSVLQPVLMQLTVVLVCGAPATGKTTTCKYLKECHSAEYTVVYLNFDDMFERYQIHISAKQFNNNNWKKCREYMAQLSMNIIFQYTKQNDKRQVLDSFLEDYYDSIRAITEELPTILLIEDNFQYISMRDEYRMMCKQNSVRSLSVLLTAPTKTCLERNSSRKGYVKEDTIVNINNNLEIKSNEFVLDTSKATTPQIVESILSKIKSINQEPILKYVSQEEQEQKREHDRLQCLKSDSHQLDLQLRKKVSQLIRDHIANVKDKQTVIRLINQEKKKFLEEMNNNSVEEFEKACLDIINRQ